MSRIRKRSEIIDNAVARMNAMELIAPAVDFGGGITVAAYRTTVEDVLAKREALNLLVMQTDAARATFLDAEANLGDLSDRMLASFGGRFGRRSPEYRKVGGKPKTGGQRKPAPVPDIAAPAAEPTLKAA